MVFEKAGVDVPPNRERHVSRREGGLWFKPASEGLVSMSLDQATAVTIRTGNPHADVDFPAHREDWHNPVTTRRQNLTSSASPATIV